MEEKQIKRIHTLTLAFGIALMPPVWAVLSPYIGVSTGAVALICAGLYVANGNKRKDAVKISIGFLLGDLWAVLAVMIMESEYRALCDIICLRRPCRDHRRNSSEVDLYPLLAVRLGNRPYDYGAYEDCCTRDTADTDRGCHAGRRSVCGSRCGCISEGADTKAVRGENVRRKARPGKTKRK